MSAQNMEPVDEFAPASEGLDEGRWRVRYLKCFESNGNYGKQNCHRLEVVDIEGETFPHYTSMRMSKGSDQREMIEVFLGRELAIDEQITPRAIKGREAIAEFAYNKNHKLKIVRFFPAEKTAAPKAPSVSVERDGVVTEAAAAPVAPPRVAPPPRPAAPPPPAQLRSDEQMARFLDLAKAQRYDEPSLVNWVHMSYPGKTLETMSPAECDALIKALEESAPDVADAAAADAEVPF